MSGLGSLDTLRLAREAGDEAKFLNVALKGEPHAIALVNMLARISQVWDDLVDRDGSPSSDSISDAFYSVLVEMPRNPFYIRHAALLQPAIETALHCWLDANELEKGDEHDKTLAFVLRDRLADVVSLCAGLVGGLAWRRDVSPEVRRMGHDETLRDYLDGLEAGGGAK